MKWFRKHQTRPVETRVSTIGQRVHIMGRPMIVQQISMRTGGGCDTATVDLIDEADLERRNREIIRSVEALGTDQTEEPA